jgi:hypothetical protein
LSCAKSKNSDQELLVDEEICPSDASDKIARAEQTPSTSDATKNQSECKMLLRVGFAAWTCLGAKFAAADC